MGGQACASVGKRVTGWLFDYLAPGLTLNFVVDLVPLALSSLEIDLAWEPELIAFFIQPVVWFGWLFFLSWISGTTGKTPGRKIAKTKLVGMRTGQPIGIRRTFLRYVCHLLDTIICYVGWAFPLWTTERQTIADMIVDTVVVDDAQW